MSVRVLETRPTDRYQDSPKASAGVLGSDPVRAPAPNADPTGRHAGSVRFAITCRTAPRGRRYTLCTRAAGVGRAWPRHPPRQRLTSHSGPIWVAVHPVPRTAAVRDMGTNRMVPSVAAIATRDLASVASNTPGAPCGVVATDQKPPVSCSVMLVDPTKRRRSRPGTGTGTPCAPVAAPSGSPAVGSTTPPFDA